MAGLANFKGKKAAPFTTGGKRRKAKAVLAKAKKAKEPDADDLATGLSGHEIDLDWANWDAAHKGQQRTKKATATGAVTRKEIKSFKRDNGLKGSGLGTGAQAALKAKAALPGHFRAKAILAAQQGDTKAAKKFEALHLRAAAMRGKSKAQVRGVPKPKAAKKAGVTHPAMLAHRFPAKSTTSTTPTRKKDPRRIPAKYRAQAEVAAHHAAAMKQNLALSSTGALSEVDLGFHFKHGWIPIDNVGRERLKAFEGAKDGHEVKITHKDGSSGLYRRTSAHNKAGVAKYENVGGSAQSLTPGQMVAHVAKAHERGSKVEHRHASD